MSSPKLLPTTKAIDYYRKGRLSTTIEELIKELQIFPTDAWLRTFLFEMFLFNGDLNRAVTELSLLNIEDVKHKFGVMSYEHNIIAEQQRERVFNGSALPEFLMAPPKYIDHYIAAINALNNRHYQEVDAQLSQAEAKLPILKGSLNGKPFTIFSDYFDFSGSYLEIFLKDRYIWLPFEQILSIDIQTPSHLSDLYWVKAKIRTINDVTGEYFLPTLYPRSYQHENELVRLGRVTDWVNLSDHYYQGFGLRTFLVGDDVKTIFNLQNMELDRS